MQHKREYSGENEGDLEMNPRVNLDGFDFSDDDPLIHTNPKSQEGDGQKTAARILFSIQDSQPADKCIFQKPCLN